MDTQTSDQMLFVTTREELAQYAGAEQLDAYRRQHGFAEYEFRFAYVMHDAAGRSRIQASFHRVAAGVGHGTLDIWARRERDQWRCHHLEALAPAV